MNHLPVCHIDRIRMESDGPGVRTLVIVRGCPLQCKLCFNKSTWDGSAPYTYFSQEELFRTLQIDDLYFRTTGGGITFGGGEPLLYADFLHSFCTSFCKNWKVCIETSLNVPEEAFRKLLDTDIHFIVDVKSLDKKIYQSYTGADPKNAYRNLGILLTGCPDRYTLRIPMIPYYKGKKKALIEKELLQARGAQNVEVFRYYRISRKTGKPIIWM